MIPKASICDFPKKNLKNLFLEADTILILQDPDFNLSIMSENFSAAVNEFLIKKGLREKKILMLCTAYKKLFNLNKSFNKIIEHSEYLNFLKKSVKRKQNLLVIDFCNDAKGRFFFEFDRMTKWPVKQRPYFSQITFHWQSLPQGKGERNALSCRYLKLAEEIFQEDIFVKPRFPKSYLPLDSEIRFNTAIQTYDFNLKKLKQVCFYFNRNAETQSLTAQQIFTLIDLLIKKKGNIEINILLEQKDYTDKILIKELKEEIKKRSGFSLLRPRQFHVICFNELFDLMVFLSKQKIIIGEAGGMINLSNSLGVKSISFQAVYSRSFIVNYRLDNVFYPKTNYCEYLEKTRKWEGKGYISPCNENGKCLKQKPCMQFLDLEAAVKEIIMNI